jgi:hypothetical protein
MVGIYFFYLLTAILTASLVVCTRFLPSYVNRGIEERTKVELELSDHTCASTLMRPKTQK